MLARHQNVHCSGAYVQPPPPIPLPMKPTPPASRGLWNPQISRRSGLTRRGVAVAITAAAAAGVILFSLRPAPKVTIDPLTQQVPDITTIPQVQSSRALNNLGAGEGLFISMADKRDPTRIAAQLQAAKSTPMEGKRYAMEEPRLWIYLRDGRTVYVEADSGRALIPDFAGSRPEDGLIKGDVIMRMFAATPTGQRPDPATATPTLTLKTEELTFDLRVGEIRFPGEVTLVGDQVDFDGSQVLIVLDDAGASLQLLRIASTRKLVYIPLQSKVAAASGPPARATPAFIAAPHILPANYVPPTPGSRPFPPPSAPTTVFYAISASGDVNIAQAARSVSGQQVNAYVRLVDGQLPEVSEAPGAKPLSDAPPTNTPPTTTATNKPQPNVNNNSSPALPPAKSMATPLAPPLAPPPSQSPSTSAKGDAGSQPIHFAFTGPLEVKQLRTSPSQLESNNLWASCTSPPGTSPRVTLRDDDQNVWGQGHQVWYTSPSRHAAIIGDSANPARIAREGSGSAWATSFEFLPATGLVKAFGAGQLTAESNKDVNIISSVKTSPSTRTVVTSESKPITTTSTASKSTQPTDSSIPTPTPTATPTAGSISWQQDALFTFALDQGEMSRRLQSVLVRGSFVGSNASSPTAPANDDLNLSLSTPANSIRGDELLASFTPIDEATSYLSSMVVTGHAHASDGQTNSLAADTLNVTFVRAGEGTQSDPSLVLATGAVTAKQKDSTLTADTLEAVLERNINSTTGKRGLEVALATATGNTRFDRADGVFASSPRLVAKPTLQLVTLSGPRSAVGQHQSRIEGNTIALDGAARTLAVEGPGSFSHADESGNQSANASWASGMTFDDEANTLYCHGSAQAAVTTGQTSKDALAANEITIQLERTPPEISSTTNQPASQTSQSQPNASTPQQDKISPRPSSSPLTGDRRVVGLLAQGRQTSPAAPATVELRRYLAPTATPSTSPAPPTLTRLMYLEGMTIRALNLADSATARLEVPTPGRLLTLDATQSPPTLPAPKNAIAALAAASPASSRGGLTAKGTALFTWNQDFTFDRASGDATLRGTGLAGVRLVHDAAADGLRSELECLSLVAKIDSAASPSPSPAPRSESNEDLQATESFGGEFRSAIATGSVWLRSRGRELTSETLTYDAASGLIDATAAPGQLVMLSNPNSATPISAGEIMWNLRDDGIRIINAQPIVAPR